SACDILSRVVLSCARRKRGEAMAGTMLALQGLQKNTLVAGKTTAIRMFTDAGTLSVVDHIQSTIWRVDGSQVLQQWSKSDFVAIATSGMGPSVAARIPGSQLPWVGPYDLQVTLFDAAGTARASYSGQINLLPTKDLRMMVSRLWSGTPTKPG